MTDHVKNQLCQRIEELEKEKLELNEQLDIAQRECDALAAHVERLEDIIERSTLADSPAAESALEDTPETSLARLKAQWQADAVSEFALHHLGGHEQEVAEIYASRLCRQAEGGEA